MKKLFLILGIFLFSVCSCLAQEYKLEAGVSIEELPKAFYGNWRVVAKIKESNSYGSFKPQSADMWTIARNGDRVSLSNPYTGAYAEISIKTVQGNLIVFSKKAPYDNKILTDTVTIRLEDNKFTGINDLVLETFSLLDNHLMKTERAKYLITGEKLSGDNILNKN